MLGMQNETDHEIHYLRFLNLIHAGPTTVFSFTQPLCVLIKNHDTRSRIDSQMKILFLK